MSTDLRGEDRTLGPLVTKAANQGMSDLVQEYQRHLDFMGAERRRWQEELGQCRAELAEDRAQYAARLSELSSDSQRRPYSAVQTVSRFLALAMVMAGFFLAFGVAVAMILDSI